MIFRSFVVVVLASGSSIWAFVVQPQKGFGPSSTRLLLQTTENDAVDVSIPYDAAAKLAYEAAGSEGDYAAFREKFEADAVADVIVKRNNNSEHAHNSDNNATPELVVALDSQTVAVQDVPRTNGPQHNNKSNKQIAHLQKKLHYWKGEQHNMEAAYKRYLQQKAIDCKTPPIYIREGKIDHYKPRPIFDKETERIQTEIWSIKEQIKLTLAKIAEEKRVQEVRQETADRIANFDEEIGRLEDQFQGQLNQAQEEKDEIQQKADETSQQLTEKVQEMDVLAKELEQAKEEQERIRKEAEARMQALEAEYMASIENMREQSEMRLSEKEEEIDNLSKEIQSLIMQLQDKRNQLQERDGVISSLESELEEKECILVTLRRERDSLRSLVGQSWKVMKTRFRKRVLRKAEEGAEDDMEDSIDGDEGEYEEAAERSDAEKVLVAARGRKY